MSRLYVLSEGTAARRRFPIYLVDATDGITPETGEAGGQPQISKAGGAWANTTATLTDIGNGAYYVELTATELNTLGMIQVRYKSAATAEFNMDGLVSAMDIHDAVRLGLTAMPNVASGSAGAIITSGTGTAQLSVASGRANADLTHIATVAVSTTTAQLGVNVVQAGATAWGSGAITAGAFAADAITAAKIADGAIDAATFAAGAINAAAIAADAITDAKVASDVTIASVTGAVGSVTGAVGSVTGAVGSVTGAVGSVTGNVGGNVAGSVGSVATGGIAAASFAAGAIDAAAIATDAIGALELAAGAASEIATAVRTELATELARLDVASSTRASQTSVDTIDDFLDTEVAAIKAKTDLLPAAIDGLTITQWMEVVGATVGGKLSGAGTATEVFLGVDGLTTRVTATVDSAGNRTAIVYNV